MMKKVRNTILSDMAEELFDGNIASEMTLGEAIVRGILKSPTYILSVYSYQDDMEKYKNRINRAKSHAVRDEAEKYYEDVIEYQEQEEQRQEELEYKVIDYVHKLKKSELEQCLLQMLFDGPDWQYERFIRENIEF